MFRDRRGRAALAAAVTAVTALAGPAWAGVGKGPSAEPVTVVAEGLDAPFGLTFAGGDLYVAEGVLGEITRIDPRTGLTSTVAGGLNFPASVDKAGGDLYVITGGAAPDAPPGPGDASVFRVGKDGTATLMADLEAYELAHNPDGQDQNFPDALTNPFDVLARRGSGGGVLVADGGGNDVLAVSRTGEVSTFFVPPTVNTGGCAGVPNNDPAHTGCDSVPTGLAYGPGHTLYVSALTGEVPGEGRVYVLDARTGEVLDVLTGFNGPTGVTVAPNGTVYVSEVFGAPEGWQGPPGRIVRIDRDGTRSYAMVPLPVGVEYHAGTLYATAWSVAAFDGIADAGQVVAVADSAFE